MTFPPAADAERHAPEQPEPQPRAAVVRQSAGEESESLEPPPPVLDEPPAPPRIRRVSDLIRVIAYFVGIAFLTLIGMVANATTSGLDSDLSRGGALAPRLLVTVVLAAAEIVMAIVPIGLAIERIIQRDAARVADGVLAAALACLLGFGLLLTGPLPSHASETVGRHAGSGVLFLISVVAYVTVVGFGNRHTLQTFVWSCLIVAAVATLIDGQTTLIAILVTFLLGRLAAFGWRYARGAANARPSGNDVVTALASAGLQPVACRWLPTSDERRRYEAISANRGALDVTVLDRDRQAAGLPLRLYNRIRLRTPAQRYTLGSMRRSLEQEALMAYAINAAGIRSPELITVRELGPDAAMLAYRRVSGRTIAELPEHELTDELLTKVWRLFDELRQHRLAHRGLTADNLLVDAEGTVWLLNLRTGEVAASGLQLNLDAAELLADMSARFGVARTVRAASRVLGSEAVAATMPLLQPVLLSRATRAALRRADGDVLHDIREEILQGHPRVEVEPVHLERLRPRTLFTVIGGTIAGYLVLTAVTNPQLGRAISSISWSWAIVALLASAMGYVGSAMELIGFVPEKLRFGRTVLSQIAASFVSVFTPSSVGGIAVNTRYLQKAEVQPGLAVTSIGASQLVALVVHVLLLMLFGFISGTQQDQHLAPSTTLVIIMLAAAVAVLLVFVIGPLRRFALAKLRPFFSGVVPRMLDVLQDPVKLATGVGGAALVTLCNVVCLWAAVEAFHGSPRLTFANVAVVSLVGSAVGAAIPTPGGVGGIDYSLVFGLAALGMPSATATPAVLLFRLLTLYLRMPPGWLAFTFMQRRDWL